MFLQWALPRMGFRWPGFRKVRRQVCKRVARRLREVGIEDLEAYRRLLRTSPAEWRHLDSCCRITISRFFRDRGVQRVLATEILPRLAADLAACGESVLRAWSAGCGAGEEPYTLSLLHRHSDDPGLESSRLEILATDSDSHQLERARNAVYPPSSLRDVPERLRRSAFEGLESGELRLRRREREGVRFLHQDLRRALPDGPFRLILCRNLAFTYFDEETQRRVLAALAGRLVERGFLVIGSHERLPQHAVPLAPWAGCPAVFEKRPAA